VTGAAPAPVWAVSAVTAAGVAAGYRPGQTTQTNAATSAKGDSAMQSPARRLALAILAAAAGMGVAAGVQASEKTFGELDAPGALAQVERESLAAARGRDVAESVTVMPGVAGAQTAQLPAMVDSRGR